VTTVYTLSEHLLLSAKAKALVGSSEEAFAEHVALAAELLGVSEEVYTDTDLVTVLRALAYQVNWQLQFDMDALLYSSTSSSASKQSVTYREGISLVSPFALGILRRFRSSSGWGNIKAVR